MEALRARVEQLERDMPRCQIGPYKSTAPAATGAVDLVLWVNGLPVTYRLLAGS